MLFEIRLHKNARAQDANFKICRKILRNPELNNKNFKELTASDQTLTF